MNATPAAPSTPTGERGGVRSYDARSYSAAAALAAKCGRTISVCIPCRNEAATIGPLVAMLRLELMERVPLIDELIVLDDGSSDDSAAVAAAGGATVVSVDVVNGFFGEGHGKGNALWASLATSTGDFVVWCDADVTSVQPSWIIGLLMPLLTEPDISLVKANYRRPTDTGGGGRTTELVARPLLSLLLPELAGLYQPLSGEYAARRTTIEQIPFVQGWGVEIAMLIDIADRFGIASIAQVDVGERLHRHQTLERLGVQAAEVIATVLARVGADKLFAARGGGDLALLRPDGSAEQLNLDERPPLRSVEPLA